MARHRKEERPRLPEALFWALTWGLGSGIGVALGGWLTVVGGSGTPGVGGLDIGTDLIALPLSVVVFVTVVHLVGQYVASALRGRSRERTQGQHAE